jgi:hypothetical protein
MNQRQAKSLKRRSRILLNQWVSDNILIKEELEKAPNKSKLYKYVPYSMHLYKHTGTRNALFTQRWAYKLVKKHPDISYADFCKGSVM